VVLSPLVCTSWVHQHDNPDGRQSGKCFMSATCIIALDSHHRCAVYTPSLFD